MTLKDWEKKILASPGAEARVSEIEHELHMLVELTAPMKGESEFRHKHYLKTKTQKPNLYEEEAEV